MSKEFLDKPPRQKCPYGFTCSKMPKLYSFTCSKMLKLSKSDTETEDCGNISQCAKAVKYGSQRFLRSGVYEKIKSRFRLLSQSRKKLTRKEKRELEEIHQIFFFVSSIRKHERAALTIKRRGKGQNFSDFDIYEKISIIEKLLKQLRSNIHNGYYLERDFINCIDYIDYIAPEGVEVNSYSVKHPPTSKFPQGTPPEEIRKKQKVYLYHKLQSKTAEFTSSKENGKKCKVIHLGRSNDEKNIQARLGIERRNRLSKIRTRLFQAETALKEAVELAAWEFSFDDIIEKSDKED